MRVLASIVVAILALAALALAFVIEFPEKARPLLPSSIAVILPPPLPAARAPGAVRWLDQNWSEADRFWVHHASQGTSTFPIPYAWFLALEQPGLTLFSAPGLLSDAAYLSRMGFIPSPKSLESVPAELRAFGYGESGATPAPTAPSTSLKWDPPGNPDGLPVGFARVSTKADPAGFGVSDPNLGPEWSERIGLTCAACHTGRIFYKGVELRIDGAPAMLNLNALEQAVSFSIYYTLHVPFRFDRFADRVLGQGANHAADHSADLAAREKLRAALTATFDAILAGVQSSQAMDAEFAKKAGHAGTPEGFFRIDALNRIGNRLFNQDLGGGPEVAANYHPTDAPVRFPPLWDVPWVAWAEYNASIGQPLMRNVGEALGVGAMLDVKGEPSGKTLMTSSVALPNIIWIEDLLRGGDFFSPDKGGLRAPKWPGDHFVGDPAWAIDKAKVARGRALYAEICAGCHLGPVDDPAFDAAYPDKALKGSNAWRTDAGGGKSLALRQIPVEVVGTDSAQSLTLADREVTPPAPFHIEPRRDIGDTYHCQADIPDYVGKPQPFGLALMATVDRIERKWMDDNGVAEADRPALFGARPGCPNPEQKPIYRARTLDGVWAMAPYLHNGSVPSLDLLLRKASQRPTKFCLGARDYDPGKVGYPADADCAEGETLFSTVDATGKPLNGNSVAGHSFEDGGHKPGVVGRALSDGERGDLIEYLKTL